MPKLISHSIQINFIKFQSYFDNNIETVSKTLKDSANKILEDFDLMLEMYRDKK